AKTVAEKAGTNERDVHSVLQTMCWRPQHGAKAERKKIGKEIHYRIFKQDKSLSVEELTTELRPIVEGLKIEGKKNMATMVPAEVAMLAARLERLLNEWAERSPRRIVGHGKAIHTYVPRSTTNVSAC